ncbi:envelope integrity protein Cei [Qaidamihabitans albus]|uniref:envelope integrity protein Cei n=1 Tax=Qaidamihabitans albus TaxID=2795733 RepID=UPI0018F111ED|nr:envelope integrity protein Cei [Qaidamihabitans albus]
MASGTGFGSRGGKPYRRHKPLPALIVIAVLGLAAVFVWVNAITSKEDIDAAIRCEPAATPPPGVTYTSLPHDALDGTTPIPPDKVALRVLNANGARGKASITTESLRELGFTRIAAPANDPAYPKLAAACHGQIRFGENGRAAARTVSLIDPCFELIRDNRKDATVDLSIGEQFGDVRPTAEGMQILQRLKTWSAENQHVGNNEQSAGPPGPELDPAKLAAARQGYC